MAEDPRYRLVYEESVRSLSDQQSALDQLRGRTGTLLSAASISTSFLGGLAVRGGWIGLWGWIAMASFVALGIFVLLILLPATWAFEVRADDVLAEYIESDEGTNLEEMERHLALYRQESFDDNEHRLSRLFLWFRLASISLVIEILAWLIDFGTG